MSDKEQPPARTPSSPDVATDSTRQDDAEARGAVFPIIGIGASAGGLAAFRQLLDVLPTDTGASFILLQHLPPSHESMLADILSCITSMPVTEVRDEPPVEPNHVYIIPPDRDMIISGGNLQLFPRSETHGQYHPIDTFFRTLAEDQGRNAIGVVLSGAATDGTLGLEEIKSADGITFVQDGTAEHGGMPQSAIASDCADFVLPPGRIAEEIARIARHPYMTTSSKGGQLGGRRNAPRRGKRVGRGRG